GMHRAQRVFIKKVYTGYGQEFDRKRAESEVKIRNELREAGLPVPKTGVWEIKEGEEKGVYLIMSPFLRGKEKRSKLQPLNPFRAEPTFLESLNMKSTHDRKLVTDLAHATAVMLNHGIVASFFDFFGVYRRKDGSWHYVIMDTGDLRTAHSVEEVRHARDEMISEIQRGTGTGWEDVIVRWDGEEPTVFETFTQELKENLSRELRKGML
ncbi:MAG: hypothetical protein AABY11_00220, partial [archaeon]